MMFGQPRTPDPALTRVASNTDGAPRFVSLDATFIDPTPVAHRVVFLQKGVQQVACGQMFGTTLRADAAAYICEPCNEPECFGPTEKLPWQNREPYCIMCAHHQTVCRCPVKQSSKTVPNLVR